MERFIEWSGHRTWVRIEGDVDGGKVPIVALHGGPGFPSNYLEPLVGLADGGRGVLLYDQLGCGNSAIEDGDDSLWVMQTFVDELDAVLAGFELERFCLLGHSWGGWLALEYVLQKRPPHLAGLVLASTCASLPAFAATTRSLKDGLSVDIREALDRHEADGTTDSEEYRLASRAYMNRHLIRTEYPEPLLASAAGRNDHIYARMQGPEWNVTGNLKDWDVTDRLHEITVPVLITSGRFDEMTPGLVSSMADRLADARWVVFEESAHMAFLEEPTAYLRALSGYLEGLDGD